MKKIRNPFTDKDSSRHDYNCFGCSPFNKTGLQLQFWEDEDKLIAKWNPTKSMEGWTGVLHGGIQSTLIDELAGWIVLIKMKTSGVTKNLNLQFLKPVFISRGEITVKGKVVSSENKSAKISCALYDGEGTKCVTADVEYYCFPENIAKAKYHYPGIQAFYE